MLQSLITDFWNVFFSRFKIFIERENISDRRSNYVDVKWQLMVISNVHIEECCENTSDYDISIEIFKGSSKAPLVCFHEFLVNTKIMYHSQIDFQTRTKYFN